MTSLSKDWWNEDRCDLFRSLDVIVADAPNPDRIGLCLNTILNVLELYDDPQQGRGNWLFDDELELADALGRLLNDASKDAKLISAGPAALASNVWPKTRETAKALLSLMAANGDFPCEIVRETRRTSGSGLGDPTDWPAIYTRFLWLSVAVCLFSSLIVAMEFQGEDAKLTSSALLLLAAIGAAFARALRSIEEISWWHWLLGAVLVAPGLFFTAML